MVNNDLETYYENLKIIHLPRSTDLNFGSIPMRDDRFKNSLVRLVPLHKFYCLMYLSA